MDLKEKARVSANILGVKNIELLDFPDNRMDSINLLDVIKPIEKKIKILKPDVLIIHHLGDLNIDHQIVHKASITACRPFQGQKVKRILSFEVPSATEWQSSIDERVFLPNWYEDISDTLEIKINALKAYSSEMKQWPDPRSLEAVEHLARWRGASVGHKAAEAFMLVREVRY